MKLKIKEHKMKITLGNYSYSVYKSDAPKITGTSYREIYKKAQIYYRIIKSSTKRQPYIRSKYFKNQKIFFNYFWVHLSEKVHKVRNKRLKLFLLGLDLIKNSNQSPLIQDKGKEIWYKFAGQNNYKEIFFVQIKETKKSKRKQLMSIYPRK